VQQHATSFIAHTEANTGAEVPRFIKDESDAFLECGILAYGSLRLRCGECGHDKLLAFNCKRRGFCASCGARRMSQTAAHLVDHGIPHVPMRQRVTSMYDGSSESALLTGLMWLAAGHECPNAEATVSAMEYGTVRVDHVNDALRADQWLENHSDAPHAMRVQIKRQLHDASYVDTEGWKSRVLKQGIEAAHQAVASLGR
jgi:hypothetical protein